MPAIRLEHIVKIYKDNKRGASGTLELDLTIRQGEFVFIKGERGSGKSTLIELIAGEQDPDRGKLWLGGADLLRLSGYDRAELRKCMGVVLESDELRKSETIFKNLASANRLEYLKNRLFDRPKIDKALSLVGLNTDAECDASELTGSECCRALLAKAIWRSPPILLLDGLTERADDDTVWDMLHLLTALNRRGTTVVMTTLGSYGEMLCKRVVTLKDGKIASDIRRS
ncbi:MAG: ATP-binding cassette domain-containing protein [Oscillospiraceae bacterium]|nr:ATP-binding cassette domain-containing protein [Oscillospiraceae bacterium]